ncbi:unnamed protein product [Phytophthora fragariaefolia]|uniref:Unnamed protein product n=1 Tax=Phytophthora fragariaefolia TaxID=1490495 RepID=A0A9W7CLU4_9STRA|nr:unnamed protein product [Phytophthora fragariaefolia]
MTPTACLDLRETLPATHATLSQSAQPCTTTQLTDHSIQSLQFVESTLPGSHSVSNDLESVRHVRFSVVQLKDSRRTGILMGEIPSALVGHLPEQVESTSSVAEAVRVATKHKPSRDGITQIYYQGHEYTKRAASGVKITYTCSFYRKPTWCTSKMFFYSHTMGFDYQNIEPHTCSSRFTPQQSLIPGESACRRLTQRSLKYDGLNIFLDGTFRSTPKPFLQCVTLMLYDPGTHLYVPVFFALMTSRTEDCYIRLLYCIEFAVGTKPNLNTVVSDFESALISAVGEHYPTSRIIGCLFHLKPALRRKLKDYRFSDAETSIAIKRGSLDMLTVIDPAKVELQGVAWVKANTRKRCKVQNIMYSQKKWRRFCKSYPALSTFVEDLARSYADLRKTILAKVADAPQRRVVKLPRAPTLPALKDIVASDTDEEENVVNEHDVTGGTAIDEAEGKSDEELNVSDDVSSSGEEGAPHNMTPRFSTRQRRSYRQS